MWIYQSKIGLMRIYPNANQQSFNLEIKGVVWGNYSSAVAAADDVYTFTTGCFDWDSHCDDTEFMLSAPSDLSEWDKAL